MYSEQMTQGLCVVGAIDPINQAPGNPAVTPFVDMLKFKRAIFYLDVGVIGGGGVTVSMALQVAPPVGATPVPGAWTSVSAVLPATFSIFAITPIVAANQQASLEIRADQMAAITSPSTLMRFARALITVAIGNAFLQQLVLGGESVQKPASQYSVSTYTPYVLAGPT